MQIICQQNNALQRKSFAQNKTHPTLSKQHIELSYDTRSNNGSMFILVIKVNGSPPLKLK
jgi:hypothetical protein